LAHDTCCIHGNLGNSAEKLRQFNTNGRTDIVVSSSSNAIVGICHERIAIPRIPLKPWRCCDGKGVGSHALRHRRRPAFQDDHCRLGSPKEILGRYRSTVFAEKRLVVRPAYSRQWQSRVGGGPRERATKNEGRQRCQGRLHRHQRLRENRRPLANGVAPRPAEASIRENQPR